jgi:hypothetical protein
MSEAWEFEPAPKTGPTSTTMIDRVSTAITKADMLGDDQAIAAIEAMREPTKEMLACSIGYIDPDQFWAAWRWMVDEALGKHA